MLNTFVDYAVPIDLIITFYSHLTIHNKSGKHFYTATASALNHLAKLAKWLSCVVSTYLYGTFDSMFLSCLVRISA